MAQSKHACRIRVGTSGYSYNEWVEAGFYPPGTAGVGMLPYYSSVFGITELNYTWYQMPRAEAIDRMQKTAGVDFMFAAKLTRTLTHEIEAKKWEGEAARFRDGIAPLVQSGRLAAVLVQLPPFFDRTPANRRYLSALLERLDPLPLAVEFRNDSWATQRVFDGLAARNVALAAVDAPELPGLFPPLGVLTCHDFFYVRFHGRNAAGWRSGNMQSQFDYDYGEAELSGWIDDRIAPMAARAKAGFVFFNNHVRAQAPDNARTMIRLLSDAGLAVAGGSRSQAAGDRFGV